MNNDPKCTRFCDMDAPSIEQKNLVKNNKLEEWKIWWRDRGNANSYHYKKTKCKRRWGILKRNRRNFEQSEGRRRGKKAYKIELLGYTEQQIWKKTIKK